MEPSKLLYLEGEYDISVDEKNRFSVPSELRRAIDTQEYGENLVVVMGVNNRPWIYPDRYYRKLMSIRPSLQAESAEALLRVIHSSVSMTFTVAMDKQGRFVLPDKIIRRSHLKDDLGDKAGSVDVTVAGAVDHIEIWRRGDWENHCTDLNTNPEDIAFRTKMLMSQFDKAKKETAASDSAQLVEPPAA